MWVFLHVRDWMNTEINGECQYFHPVVFIETPEWEFPSSNRSGIQDPQEPWALFENLYPIPGFSELITGGEMVRDYREGSWINRHQWKNCGWFVANLKPGTSFYNCTASGIRFYCWHQVSAKCRCNEFRGSELFEFDPTSPIPMSEDCW